MPGRSLRTVEPVRSPRVGIVEARQIPLEHPKKFDPVDGSTSWASGACMMIRAELLQQIGGFDGDSFFMYCDDVDFSWRARLAGYQVIHQPSARVFHDKRIQVDGRLVVSDAERYYSAEAALLMAWKYSRPDLVALWSEEMLATSESPKVKAVQEFPRPRRGWRAAYSTGSRGQGRRVRWVLLRRASVRRTCLIAIGSHPLRVQSTRTWWASSDSIMQPKAKSCLISGAGSGRRLRRSVTSAFLTSASIVTLGACKI